MAESRSLVDIAYDILTQQYEANGNKSIPMPFGELLINVGRVIGTTDENHLIDLASRFYTALTTDGRFVIKENNTWVLREHELYENVHIDMNDVYSDADAEPVEDELGKEDEMTEEKDIDEEENEEDDAKELLNTDEDEDE